MGNNQNNQNSKIRKYKKPKNINIGMVIFGFIFLYTVICVFMYATDKHISQYEVKEGSLSTQDVYEGIIIRDEAVVTNDSAGYVNYYARENERVAVGDLVYTVDQTGQLSEYLNSSSGEESTLSDKQLTEIKSEIMNFTHNFSTNNFSNVYDFKYTLQGTVLKLASSSLMEDISSLNADGGIQINYCNAPVAGVVSYWVDGFEALKPSEVTKACFNQKEYKKTQLVNNDLIEQGGTVYKVNSNENWSLVIPFDAQNGAQLVEDEEGYIKVRFLKNQYEAWASVSVLTNADGDSYLQLDFTNSMITFVSDRFIDVELIVDDETGLKIPNSSIVEKEFFLVPEAYVTQGGKRGNDGVLKQSYLEDGSMSTDFTETTIYNKADGEYYLDNSTLRIGDILVMPGSTETFVLSKRATLIGVYNINKGYADFRRIDILNQNEEYSIVRSNTQYGLNVYDLIVLDSASVEENEFIYE